MKNIPLKWKIFFIVLINVGALLSISLLGFGILSRTYNELLYRSVSGNLSFSAYTLSTDLKDMERLSSILLATPEVQNSLSAIHETDDAVVWSDANRNINISLSTYYESFRQSGVTYLLLYNDAFSNTTNWPAYRRTNETLLLDALENADRADGGISWTLGSRQDSAIILGRNIRKIEGMDFSTIGRLLIYVDLEHLISRINQSFQTFETACYILSDGTAPVYASASLSVHLVDEALSVPRDSYQTLKLDGHTWFVVSSRIPYYDWSYISLVPFDSITYTISRSARLILVIIVMGVFIALVLTQWLIRSMIYHFNVLIDKMDTFSRNELELAPSAYDYSTRNDEIGHLHQRFDRMAMRIRTLVDTNYRNELLKKEAQIKALESQINPHFLYNTLDSINWRAKASNNREISLMAESLGTVLRSTLNNKASIVSLDYELELVHAYITIQKIRFEDRLSFTCQVDHEVEAILIPPLSIQPLIENAIRYGMEEMTETCHVALMICRTDTGVLIQVKNSGSAFDEDLLAKLASHEKEPRGFGIGLLNIRQRIQLLYGNGWGLFLKNEDGWAIAQIHIPYQTKENLPC